MATTKKSASSIRGTPRGVIASVTPTEAAAKTARISGTLRRAAGGVRMLGAGYWGTRAVRAIPVLGSVVAKGAARRFLGPAATIMDIATTAQAGYEGVKAAKSLSELDIAAERAAEKYGVRTKRRGKLSLLREALTSPIADMDPGVKVYNPKTHKWD